MMFNDMTSLFIDQFKQIRIAQGSHMQAKSKGLYILHKQMPNVAEKPAVKKVLVKSRSIWAKGKI